MLLFQLIVRITHQFNTNDYDYDIYDYYFQLFQKNIDNDIGTKNNLVSVRKSDFEVFQALAKDIEEGGGTTQKEYSQVSVIVRFNTKTEL